MGNKTIILKVIRGVIYVGCIILAVCFVRYVDRTNQTVDEKDQKIASLEKQVKQSNEQYENLYAQKNGTANDVLESSVNALFSTIFNYDSSKDEGSVKVRKDKASKLTNGTALDEIFPKGSEKTKPSVQTVSKIDGNPEIYVQPSNASIKKVFVIVKNSVSIAGSDDQKGQFLYKLEFDAVKSQFIKIENAGILND